MNDQYRPYEPPSEPEPEGTGDGPAPGSPQDPASPYGQRDPRYDPFDPLHPFDAQHLTALGFVPAHTGALRAVTLGVASVFLAVLNLFCCFSGLISLVIGPIAVARGLRARREIDADPGRYGNRGMAVTGIVTGAVGTVLGALTTLFYLFYVGVAFNTGYVY